MLRALTIAFALALATGLQAGNARAADAASLAATPQYYFGADLSYVNEIEDCGATFAVQGKRRDPFELLRERGANLVRVRIWNDATWTRYSNLADVRKTIARARRAGMQVLLDFHYSDDWADGDKQVIPKAWAQLRDSEALAGELYAFTYRTLEQLAAEGLMPELVQVGNETNGEILSTLEDAKRPIDWQRNARLFNAGIRAVRDAGAAVGTRPRVMLHIAQPENVEPWFAAAAAAGVSDFDMIGISYYRKWSSMDLAGLGATIDRLRRRYAADILLVETAYPWTLQNADASNNILGEDSLIPGYPATREGQRQYLIDLTQLVIDNGGVGTVYWEPAWISSSCKTRWGTGSGWDNAALFDWRGRLLPGADYLDHAYRYPQDHNSAGNFNRDWQFHRFEAAATRAGVVTLPASAWESVSLPHSARLEPRIVNDQWQGDAVYRKQFVAPERWRGKRIWLRFEGAMNVAEVWLNGRRLAAHLGGYLPFTLDLTDSLRPGAGNELLVWLDNRDNAVTGPKPLEILDFNTYGGLYRDVSLIVKPLVHITDEIMENRPAGGGVFVTYPQATAQSAEVSVRTHARNASARQAAYRVRHELLDGAKVVARGESRARQLRAGAAAHTAVTLRVDAPRLWSPRSPELYELVTRVEVDGRTLDEARTRIGIRRVHIDRAGFRINGEKMFLRGVNRHQEYPYVGYAISPAADYRDAKRIKEAGFDFVRLSHYPQSPAFMAAADELGLVVLNSILGWQFFNTDLAFEQQVLQTCRDLVRRDRNHPSVIAWECSLNETQMPAELVQRFHRAVHEEYPGDQAYSAGWQDDGYDVYIQARQHRIEHERAASAKGGLAAGAESALAAGAESAPAADTEGAGAASAENPRAHSPRPYLVSEYGDWEYYALNAGFNQQAWADLVPEARSSRQLLADGEMRLLQQATNVQEAHNDNFTTLAFADAYWVMFDYNRGYADDLEASGAMSLERVPKFSYHFFRSQRDAAEVSARFVSGPMVYIASYWTAASPLRVRVYGNVEEVELRVDGRSLARHRPDTGRTADRLAHGPFTFEVPVFAPGTLQAIGYIGGRAVAQDSRTTPQAPAALQVELDDAGICAEEGDLVFARARLLDGNGTTVPESGRRVQFVTDAGLDLVGVASAVTEAGIASVLVRVTDPRAAAQIRASSAEYRAGMVHRPGEKCRARSPEHP